MVTATDSKASLSSAPICYGSGVADPDFYFPAASDSARTSYRDRISTLPTMLLRLIRR